MNIFFAAPSAWLKRASCVAMTEGVFMEEILMPVVDGVARFSGDRSYTAVQGRMFLLQ